MTVNTTYQAAVVARASVDFRNYLGQVRAIGVEFSTGASTLTRTIQSLKNLDQIHGLVSALWAGPLAATRSTAESTALGLVATRLDDLLLAFADAMSGATVPQVIDLGAGYDPGAGRATRLATINRAFPFASFAIPQPVSAAAGALVAAIDALTALTT